MTARFRAAVLSLLGGGLPHQPDSVMAGTQVVSLVEIRGPSGSLVHSRGAVGAAIGTLEVEVENFLVRFPDGF